MKLKTRQPRGPEINVGSFADIAFLLIIFFILPATFLKPAGAKLLDQGRSTVGLKVPGKCDQT